MGIASRMAASTAASRDSGYRAQAKRRGGKGFKATSAFKDKTDWGHKRRLRRKRENKKKDAYNRWIDQQWKGRTTTELKGTENTSDLEGIYGEEVGDAILGAFASGQKGGFSASKMGDKGFEELKVEDIGSAAESIQSRRNIRERLKKGKYAGASGDNIFSSKKKKQGGNWAAQAQSSPFAGGLSA